MTDKRTNRRAFAMVDVFADTPFTGNPLPVLIDAHGLSGDEMLRITRWFNQSETTFLLPPTQPGADYRVRIFTLERELPFAGHPTLGTCRVWLDHQRGTGDAEPQRQEIVQECGAGLIRIRQDAARLSFAAPPLLRSGPVSPEKFAEVAAALRVREDEITAMAWADNGPGWIAVQMASAEAVLALEPLRHHSSRLEIGVVGPHPAGHEFAFEVRTFFSDAHGNLLEDPVTGSFNASAAQWLLSEELVQAPYRARQGTCLGRAGHIEVHEDDGQIWIGGAVQRIVNGMLDTDRF